MEARQGRDSRSEARCEARQRDRPCFLAGDAHAVVEMQRGVGDVAERPALAGQVVRATNDGLSAAL